ncbi:MAG: LamG-like jellyroll fold domain-containing protein, partial [Candidatus Micrarchaeia archaeon]
MRGHSKVWSIIIPIIFLLSLAGNFFEGPASTLLGFAPSEMGGSGWSVVDIETLVSTGNSSQNQTTNTTDYPGENNSGLVPIEEAVDTSSGAPQGNNSGLIPIEEVVDSENATSAGPSASGPEQEPQGSSKSACERMGYKSVYCITKEEKVRVAGYINEELSLGKVYLNKTEVRHDNESSRTTIICTHAVLQNLTNVEVKDTVFEGTGGSVEFSKLRLDIGSTELDLSSVLKIQRNHIGIDSEKYPQFDQPAHLVFTNLYGLNSPFPLRDGEPCPEDICSNFIYDSASGTAEFDVSGFSNYSVGEINITYAEHLDSSRGFISDITDDVYYLDGNWSEKIPVGDFVHVLFEDNLTNGRIIDVYVRSGGDSNVYFDIYPENSTTPLVGTSGQISPSEEWKLIKVQNLAEPTDSFDFEVKGGSTGYLEFDLIHDDPAVENVTLNSTYGTNYTTENLTVWYDAYDTDGDSVKNLTTWYLNSDGNASLMLTFLPFEAGSNSTWTRDYTSNELNGTPVNSPEWLATGGFDGWGTYNYTTGSDYMNLNVLAPHIDGSITTFLAWVKLDEDSSEDQYIYSGHTSGGTNRFLFGMRNSDNALILYYGTHCSPDASATFAVGDWHQVGLILDDTSQIASLYMDGEYLGDCSFADIPSDGQISLGQEFDGGTVSNEWAGPIDEVRVYDRRLTPEQIEMIYNNQTDFLSWNETTQGEVWQACVTPNDGTEDGLQNCSNNLTIAALGVENVSVDSTFGTNKTSENLTLSYDLFNSSEKGIVNWYVDEVPLLGVYFPFEAYDGRTPEVAKDYSPFGLNGTLNGVAWDPDIHDGSPGYDFDSASDYIKIDQSDASGILDAGKFTIEAWAYPDTTPADIAEIVSTIQYGGYGIGIRSNGSAYFRVDTGGTYQYIHSDYPVSTGEWHHFVGVYDETDGSMKLYMDGELNASHAFGGPYDVSNGAFCIGEQSGGSTSCTDGDNFDGKVSLVRFWNHTLSTEQIEFIYSNSIPNNISSEETYYEETWKACVLPNGYLEDSINPAVCGNLTIETPLSPIVENVTLNSTDGTNYTTENITVWYDSYSPEGSAVKNMTTWFLTNGSVTNKSIMTMFLPFEGGKESERGRDYTTYGHNVTAVHSMNYLPNGGYDGWGAYECEADTSVYMEMNNSAIDGLQDFTIMLWVNRSYSNSGDDRAIFSAAGSSSSNEFFMYVINSNIMRISIRGDSDDFTGFTLNQNEWTHMAFKRTGTTGEFFVNGQSMGTETVNGATLDVGCAGSTGFILCQEQDSCGGAFNAGQAWVGSADDIRVYNMSLEAEQIQAIAQNRTDTIVSQQTDVDDTWQACVTPNDGYQAGEQNCSNNITILEESGCQVISSPGIYALSTNAEGAPNDPSAAGISDACVVIKSDDVTFSCNGYNITNDGTAFAVGIMVAGDNTVTYENVTVENCSLVQGYYMGGYFNYVNSSHGSNLVFKNNSAGLVVRQANYNNLTNITAYNNTRGIYFTESTYNNITRSEAYNNTQEGFYLYDTCSNNRLTYNKAYNNTEHGFSFNEIATGTTATGNNATENGLDGFSLNNTNHMTLEDNRAVNNTRNGITINNTSDPSANPVTSTTGFYSDNGAYGAYSDSTTSLDFSGCTFSYNAQDGARIYDSDAVSFYPYDSSNPLIAEHNTGSGIYFEDTTNFEITATNPGSGTSDYVFLRYNTEHGVYTTGSSNGEFDGTPTYYLTTHNNTKTGFYLDNPSASDTKVQMDYLEAYNNSENGIYIRNSNKNSLEDSYFYNNSWRGVRIYDSDYNNITNTESYLNGEDGFFITSTSTHNVIEDSRAYNNTWMGFKFRTSSSLNNITNCSSTNNTQDGFSFEDAVNENNIFYSESAGNRYGILYNGPGSDNNLKNLTLYDNEADLLVYSTGGAFSFEGENVTFTNPTGSLQNYTVMDIDDSVG